METEVRDITGDSLVQLEDYIHEPADRYPEIDRLKYYLDWVSGGHIAGGVFKDIFTGKEPKDIDIFFSSHHAHHAAVAKYSASHQLIYTSLNAVGFEHSKTGDRIELVDSNMYALRNIERFDFTISKFCLVPDTDHWGNRTGEYQIIRHRSFWEDLRAKRLVIAPEQDGYIRDIPDLFGRTLRYTKYGYDLDADSQLYLFNRIAEDGIRKKQIFKDKQNSDSGYPILGDGNEQATDSK
jgi:hypothetical protein